MNAEGLFSELNRASHLLENTWRAKQNDRLDDATRFIYHCHTLQDLNRSAVESRLTQDELNYAVHRWRNFKRHEAWMQLIRESVNEMRLPNDPFNKTRDFILQVKDQWIPFDLKVTRFPLSLRSQAADPELARWFYQNQSRQQRFHLANRFFIVGQPELALYDFELARITTQQFAANVDAHCHAVRFEHGEEAVSIVLRQTQEKVA